MADMLTYLFGMLDMAKNPPPKIGRNAVKGFIVSTVHSSDMGRETAIIDKHKTHIMDRYDTEEEAQEGHKKWIKWIEDNDNFVTSSINAFKERDNIILEPMDQEEAQKMAQ